MAKQGRTRVLIAFDPKLWQSKDENIQLEERPKSKYLSPSSTKFLNTGGDIFFYIKSDEKTEADGILTELTGHLESAGINELSITKSNEYGNTLIINGSYREGLANLSDRCSIDQLILIGDKTNGGIGGTYMMTQKFKTHWEILGSKSNSTKEEMMGRKIFELGIIPSLSESSHIKRAHTLDDFPPPSNVSKGFRRIYRQSMPYGNCETHPGREEGVFYISIGKSTTIFGDILENISGCPGATYDAFLDVFSSEEGSFWYVPSFIELGLEACEDSSCKVDLDEHWDVQRKNKYLYYNHKQYLHDIEKGKDKLDGVSTRVIRLLQYTFEQWNNVWYKKADVPDIPDLSEMLGDKEKNVLKKSVSFRKGLAIKKSLGELFTTASIEEKIKKPSEFYGWKADLFNIHPDEIIVGRMPKVSTLGLGKKVMKYLNDDERMKYYLLGLSESSAVGHIIPDYNKLLKLGVNGLIQEIQNKCTTTEDNDFYQSCIFALEGVQMYLKNYSRLADKLSTLHEEYSISQIQNLAEIKSRMERLSTGKPENLTDAVQLIFSMHCCLHLIGQPVAIGRIDELLAPFVKLPINHDNQNQEIIDCFWIKFGERVILDPHQATDITSWGNCAVPYSSDGNFPRGDALNQWVQQVTVGGQNSDTTNCEKKEYVTILCLKAARRLPLNAPCLSLRLHEDMNEEIFQETAKSLLSGGAHPILLHDNRIIKALESSHHLQETPQLKEDIKNYACDGCYEPLIVGKSEFTFTYLPLPLILELTINQGDSYVSAGPAYLQGKLCSFRSVSASEISSFEQFQGIFEDHLKFQIEASMYRLLVNYGNICKACPAPLLSTLIDGCLDTGRDLYDGGAKYVIAACMFIGFSNCIDSLYSIEKLCFDRNSACVTLEEFLLALKNDWGNDMIEPFVNDNAGKIRSTEKSTFYRSLRQRVLAFPKFGTDEGAKDETIQTLAEWLSTLVVSTFENVVKNPKQDDALCQLFTKLTNEYSTPEAPFQCIFCPGSGTFEGYVGWGMSLGASADGRRKTMPIASDFSASPVIQDSNCKPSQNDIYM